MRRFSLATSILLVTILAMGFAPIWAMLASSLAAWVLPSSPPVPSMIVRQDGTPLLMHRDVASQSTLYSDLRGQPVDVNTEDPWLPWIELKPLSAEQPEDVSWNQRIRKFNDARSRPTFWYLISDGQPHGTAYFVGYDAASKYRMGFIGKNGFREDLPPAEECFPFAGGMRAVDDRVASVQAKNLYNYAGPLIEGSNDFKKWQLYLLGDDQRIYAVDLRERTVNAAFTDPHIQACELYCKNSKSPTWLIVRTDRQVLVLNQEHKVERSYTIPTKLATKSFRWAEVAPGQALATWYDYSLTVTLSMSEAIVWLDQAGNITRRETNPGNRNSDWLNVIMSLACPSLVVVGPAVLCFYPAVLIDQGATDRWSVAQAVCVEGFWPSLVFVTILSALLAVACYRRQVRDGATSAERIAWMVFVFFGGLPAWVAYRYGRNWPVLDRCPECGAEVPRDRETCAACRQEFPLPEPQGFEILTA